MPCTVIPSPGCSESALQPLCARSMGLSYSIAQLTSSFPPATFMNTWTWGLAQSTSVTMPLSVVGLVSSNFARISWWAIPGATASRSPASVRAAPTARNFIASLLLPGDFEGAIFGRRFPGADDGAVAFRKVLYLPVDDVRDRFPRFVLGVALEVHKPAFRIERRVLDRDLVAAGINRSRDGLAVPIQHDDHVIAVVLTRPPGADPGSLQRVPFLRRGGRSRGQTNQG